MYNIGWQDAEERYNQILENQKIFTESVAPLAKRFHRFLLTHQPYNVITVPVFNVDDKENSPSGPVVFEDFTLLFNEMSQKFSDRGETAGLEYLFEDWDEDVSVSQFFTVPFEYFEDPNAWETKVLMPKAKSKS